MITIEIASVWCMPTQDWTCDQSLRSYLTLDSDLNTQDYQGHLIGLGVKTNSTWRCNPYLCQEGKGSQWAKLMLCHQQSRVGVTKVVAKVTSQMKSKFKLVVPHFKIDKPELIRVSLCKGGEQLPSTSEAFPSTTQLFQEYNSTSTVTRSGGLSKATLSPSKTTYVHYWITSITKENRKIG